MKFIHLSDLHLGKRVNDFSMLEDQKYILGEILKIIDSENPEGIFIAGDIYDKTIPSAEAVELFDEFLCSLEKRKLEVFIISGNHDSPERIAFGSRIMDSSGIHLSPVYNGIITPHIMKNSDGEEIYIYMLPFIKPVNVRRFFPKKNIESYTDAVRTAIDELNIAKDKINILITHQFVTGASLSDSEEINVGGTDNVDGNVFDGFDYVALGHIHGPQSVMRETIRYCGTPLKYSFSEANHRKSVTVVEVTRSNCVINEIPLIPLHDMKKIKGAYMDLTSKEFYDSLNRQDYFHITLTDEEDILDVVNKLRVIYPNLMRLEYDNTRTKMTSKVMVDEQIEDKSPYELFAEFYKIQNGIDLSEEQASYCQHLIAEIWEEK